VEDFVMEDGYWELPVARKRNQGKLELTWTNKDQCLLAHEDGSYEWLPESDYRVAEVRLLRDAAAVGEVGPDSRRVKDNLLIRGDALHALTSLIEIPEFAREYAGKVKLVYIDPPFNTEQTFEHYEDNLEHSVWLTMMRDRLNQIQSLLAPEGSVWVHCDDYEQHHLRVVLDEVFGRSAFVTTLIWQKRTSRDNRKSFSSQHDYIHVYAPLGLAWKKVRNRLLDEGEYRNPDNDPRGPWRSIPMSAQAGHATAAQFYKLTTPTGVVHDPPRGRCWTYKKERFEELVKQNLVYWPKGGAGRPRLKKFPEESEGLVPFTIWPAGEVGDNDEAKKQILEMFPSEKPFDTPKPEGLIERIIRIGSNEGEVVLDCFLGSGTTAAVAQKMKRRWVAVEWSRETIETFASPRLTRVIAGDDAGGITEEAGWPGRRRLPDPRRRSLDVRGGRGARHSRRLGCRRRACRGDRRPVRLRVPA
jgi:adenine-specific DNA-methyltransferase